MSAKKKVSNDNHHSDREVDKDIETDNPVHVNPIDLDRLIHERLRLGIMSALAVNDWLSFRELKSLLKTTDGNLSVHARKLEDAQYITCKKFIDGRMPKTEYALTKKGRKLLSEYLQQMERIIQNMENI